MRPIVPVLTEAGSLLFLKDGSVAAELQLHSDSWLARSESVGVCMRRLQVISAVLIVVVLALTLSVATVSAAGPTNCDSGHGVFTAFADPSLHFVPSSGQPPYFVDNVLGSARGGATGENNSSYSAYCNGN